MVLPPLPVPDGTIAAEDRAHVLWIYSGINIDAPAVHSATYGTDRKVGPTVLDDLPDYLKYTQERSYVSIVDRVGSLHEQQQREAPIDARINHERDLKEKELELGRVQLERNLEFLDRLYPIDTGNALRDANNAAEREKRKDQARQVYEANARTQMADFEAGARRRKTALVNLSRAQETLEERRERQREINRQRRENLKKARRTLRRKRK